LVNNALHSGINFWIEKKLVSPNWWHNEIGIPKTMGLVFILFKNELTPKEKMGCLEIMNHSKIGKTGQNKVWLSGNVLMRGILDNNFTLIKTARDAISSELKVGHSEGITSEWCFHQHGSQQQLGNYGLSFLLDMSFYNYLFNGTTLAFTTEQSNLLYALFAESYRWIVWKGHWDINGLNRQLFKNADKQKTLSLAIAANTLTKTTDSITQNQLHLFIKQHLIAPHKPNQIVGYKHFSLSDYTLFRTTNWMASLRMASKQVIGVEKVNEDNLKGFYMADGALYTYVNGDEYHNIFPCWDWRKIPGTTTYNSLNDVPKNFKNANNDGVLVNGRPIGDGGFTTMELKKDKLNAIKSWAFTPQFIVCVGSDIKTDSTLQAMTTVDQRLQKCDVLHLKNNKWITLHNTSVQKSGVRRYFHHNTGYIILKGGLCEVKIHRAKGKWSDVMGIYKPEMVEKDIFSIAIKHAIRNRQYMYIVIPNTTKEKVEHFDVSHLKFKKNHQSHTIIIDNTAYSLN
jgi:chondroitin AC lyase